MPCTQVPGNERKFTVAFCQLHPTKPAAVSPVMDAVFSHFSHFSVVNSGIVFGSVLKIFQAHRPKPVVQIAQIIVLRQKPLH